MTDSSPGTPTSGQLDTIKQEAEKAFCSIKDEATAETFRVTYLGKKGILRGLLKSIKDIPEADRRTFGAQVNQLHDHFEQRFAAAVPAVDQPE